MTANQIAFKVAEETKRHDLAQEEIAKQQNAENIRHNAASEGISAQQNQVNKEHYERSDSASLVSANASALKAQADYGNYKMNYDIEYGWTGSEGYPSGMPLSAQKKSVELAVLAKDPHSGVPAAVQAYNLGEVEIAGKKATAVKDYMSAFNSLISGIFGKKGVAGTSQDLIQQKG